MMLVDQASLDKRKRYNRRLEALRQEYSTWRPHHIELNDWIRPRRYRYLQKDVNKGYKRNDKIISSTPLIAQRILASGMHAGITSPARPWFRMTPSNPLTSDVTSVRTWFGQVEKIMYEVLARSNLYDCLPKVYSYLGVFGTAALIIDEDEEDVIRGYVLPIGQYYIANNDRLIVDTIMREFSMTADQLVSKFGRDNCSSTVKKAYDNGQLDQWFEVVHVISPNREYDSTKADKNGMKWTSCWYEKSCSDEVAFLREQGYHEFPAMCPRWEVDGEDVYGTSPGMDALGDAKSLQNLEKRKGHIMDRLVNPPMAGPPGINRASLMPGDVTTVNAQSGSQKFEPAVQYNPNSMTAAQTVTQEVDRRIKEAFFADLWLMLSQRSDDGGGVQPISAKEVTERQEEKLLQLGPVLERVHGELLEPMLTRVFNILNRRGWLPPAPVELQGQEIKIEFISIMAQAQKLLGTSAIERLVSFVGNIAGVHQDSLDTVDFDKTIEEYAKMVGVPPECMQDPEIVKAMREAKNQQAQAQAQGQASLAAIQGAKLASETDMNGDTALNRLLGAGGGGALATVR
jgi:hypothetical protein